jgi:mono/diheme cytochrome c family protein
MLAMIFSLPPQRAQSSISTPNTRFSRRAQLIATCLRVGAFGVQRGAALYVAHCGSCHGPAAINAGGTPDLRRSPHLENLDPC